MNTQPHYMNDNALIQLLRSDKPDDSDKALRYIIIHKQKNITSKLRVPAHISEDAMFNHALFELWKYVRNHDFDTSKKDAIERFLYVVCKRYINRNLGDGDTDIAGLPEPPDNPPPPLYDYEVYEIMRKLFNSLGIGCIEILTYRFFDGMNHKEIAEKINSTDGSTRARYSQCLRKLKEWIKDNPKLGEYIRNLLTE